MFNGIIFNKGVIKKILKRPKGINIFIKSNIKLSKKDIGISVACDGVCLTLITIKNKVMEFYLSNETINRSKFKFLKINEQINLELPLKYGQKISGHICQGHVDTVGKIKNIKKIDKSYLFDFEISAKERKNIIEKASICINGISLTISKVTKKGFQIWIIPHTFKLTNLSKLNQNDLVNIEIDILSKYVKNFFYEKNNYSSIEKIIKIAQKGGMFILVDDEKRENEGDLVISTSDTNAKNINFMAKYGRGLICLALDSLQAKRLNLSLMSPVNQSRNKTAFTISIEAKKGITTGISAKDRARTIKIASKKNANKKDIVSPGHVFPIIAKDGGVLVRAGHTEASVDISKLAKKNNSAVICEIMNEDGTMAKGQELFDFAYKHNLKIGKIEDLIAYRLKKEKLIRLKKQSIIDVKKQKYKIRIYENLLDGSEHFALIKGTIKRGITPRVRVISSNVVKNYLINQQLPNSFNKTLNYFKKFNNCVLIFIKDSNLKSVTQTLKDYKNKDFYKKGKDKLIRNYGIGAQIIKDLKIKNMTLITKSPKRVIGLDGYGIKITKQEII